MDRLSCSVEVGGLVKDRSLNATASIMAHDNDVADVEVCHAVREGGNGVKVSGSVLIRDVPFGEKNTRGRREDGSF